MMVKDKNVLPRPFTSLAILFSFMMFIFLLNLNQVAQLDDRLGYRAASLQDFLFSPYTSALQQQQGEQPEQLKRRLIHHKPIPPKRKGVRKDLVKPGDFVYFRDNDRWDSAPIVMESHKLIFFTTPKVGCTVWKQLFRRMMGYDDWLKQDETTWIPHNPDTNGLKYLYNYTTEQASIMMTSPEWTRAMMVREPKERFLSAFLDKALSNNNHHVAKACCKDRSCVEGALTLDGFLKLVGTCQDDHWRPQGMRVDYKYWPYIDVVGHVENAAADAKALLQRIGAWEEFGATGWGKYGNSTIFQSKELAGAGEHATWAQWQVWKWYTPQLELKVEEFFRGDYENPLFNFTHYECLTCVAQ